MYTIIYSLSETKNFILVRQGSFITRNFTAINCQSKYISFAFSSGAIEEETQFVQETRKVFHLILHFYLKTLMRVEVLKKITKTNEK